MGWGALCLAVWTPRSLCDRIVTVEFVGGLGSGSDVQFGQDGGDVVVGGFRADVQLGGDLRAGQTVADEFKDLQLPGGEPVWVGPGARSWAACPIAGSSSPQARFSDRRRGSGAEGLECLQSLSQGGHVTGQA